MENGKQKKSYNSIFKRKSLFPEEEKDFFRFLIDFFLNLLLNKIKRKRQGETMDNQTILQGFQWELKADSHHWNHLRKIAPELKIMGITGVWLPPAYKGAAGVNDVGYGTYDLYDLGEFDQKGTIPTKYGTKEEYLSCIQTFHDLEMEVYADIVFNHFLGADEKEVVEAQEFSFNNRNEEIGEEQTIEAWSKFTFPGRKGKYNEYVWTWKNFNGVDYDSRNKEHAIFAFEGKHWSEDVDKENGNFDYLMGADLDMNNQETVENLNTWGAWYQELTKVDGYRLDAVKHIQFDFWIDWLFSRQKASLKPLFVVGEYWSDDIHALTNYLDDSGSLIRLFDVPLHFNLQKASNSLGSYDMRQLFQGTLVENRPEWAVTFVDNHDTQKGQSLESWVEGWFKLQSYSLILLRKAGTPVVFYGDLYGIPTQNIEPVGENLEILLRARRFLAYGPEVSYLDDPNVIGWTRMGDLSHPNSGFAVVLTNGKGGEKEMSLSALAGGETFVDCLGNVKEEVVISKDGLGIFSCLDGSVSVWVNKKNLPRLKVFPEEEGE